MKLAVSITSFLSAAFHQNAIPVIQEIKVDNDAEAPVCDVVLRIVGEPPVFAPLAIRIDLIGPGAIHYIRAPDLRLDAALLRNLLEGVMAEITVSVEVEGVEAARQCHSIRLLPPSHWGGLTATPELIAAFVRPNDPAVDVILHLAAQKLAGAGKRNAIDGYQDASRARAWDLAAAIWAALADQGIVYAMPPASFERTGQKVRAPSDILARKTATCLDTALLFAACLEQAGLDPLVVFAEGHAFAGVWLKRVDFADVVMDDAQSLRKRRDLEELLLIETTLLTQGRAGRFAAAVESGAAQVEEGAPRAIELGVDIHRARLRQIRPLDLGERSEAPPASEAPTLDMPLDEAPPFIEETRPVVRGGDASPDRLDRWKRKLLDLTLRNKLLNFRGTAKAIRLDCPDAARLENLLAEGKRFRFLPRVDLLTGTDERSAALHRERHGEDGRRAFLAQSLEAGDLQSDLEEADLDARLTELYRLTKTAFEEGGSNILFLAIGFLTWTQRDGGKVSRAPILLVPVSLERSSVRSRFRLCLHDEEPQLNPTLVEMLRQDFELKLPEFERDLPTEGSGLAVKSILRILRTHIRDLKGWEVTGDVVLSTFSFTKFLMWKDLVERMDRLKESPVVRHLIDTPKQSYGEAAGFPEPGRIDIDFHPRQIFAPLSADSSQLAAIMAADRGKDFVLFGPPGTGKSQTIANIIAQCLASGRTVLFVSQKTAALDVVQRRLNEIGLGDYCLEVHSAKAQKTAVLGRLKAAWQERHAPGLDDWDKATTELGDCRDELNRLVAALHRPRETGVTAYEAFGRVVAGRASLHGLRLDWPSERRPTPDGVARLKRLCHDLETALKAVGAPGVHPLRGLDTRQWTPDWRHQLDAALAGLTQALPRLGEAAAIFATAIGLQDLRLDRDGVGALRAFGTVLLAEEAAAGVHLLNQDPARRRAAVGRLAELQAEADTQRGRLSADYRSTVFELDLVALLDRWEEACGSSIFTRGARQTKVRDILAAHGEKPPEDAGSDLRALIGLEDHAVSAEALAPDLAGLGPLWRGLSTDAPSLAAASAWADAAEAAIAAFAPVSGFATRDLKPYVIRLWTDYLALVREEGTPWRALADFSATWEQTAPLLASIGGLAGRDAGMPLPAAGPDWIAETLDIAARWRLNLNRAQTWCFWNEAAAAAREAGLGVIVAALEAGTVAPTGVEAAFELALARWWADRLVTEDPVLRGFLAERHEDEIERFRQADDAVAALARRIVRGRLHGEVPPPTAFGDDVEWGALSRELTKKTRHMPLRKLFGTIPTSLTRLTPCMMMSPLSIAQYLPPGSRLFDVVIFDEASQIPAWDAVGAIARGRQAIIVGDPEQLPPTNVGERGIDDVDDGTDVEDQESILDECLAANIPSRRLAWHYRSRQESLITFANHAYYEGKLITFPSVETEERAVHLVPVPGGVYLRGKGRTNVEEARAVVRDVVRRLKEPRFAADMLSLGVVTFNGEQQRLIENLLDEARRANPEIEPFFDAARWPEPVFVKNLENVQGDERDVILFSVTFAPDETGRPIGTVSSLNKEGGHRRLNVAITRARREMAIFATLRAEDIALTGKGARGIRDLKHFLDYAERGPKALAEAAAPLDRGTESPFEDAVKQDLERRGWRVQAQIGVSAFRIDLGIVHPDAPGRYLAGVECDGATYHRSASARDRDRLRESVLRGLGWRIRRVWSTEWWMDAQTAGQKLHDRLAADLADDRAARAAGDVWLQAPNPSVLSAREDAMAWSECRPSLANDPDMPQARNAADGQPRLYADASPVRPRKS